MDEQKWSFLKSNGKRKTGKALVTQISSLTPDCQNLDELFDQLKTIAVESTSDLVEEAIVSVITANFLSHPATFDLLKTLAIGSKFERISQTAVRALAENFRDHPETFDWLKIIALESTSEKISQTAVWATAQNFSTHPEIIALESPTKSTYIPHSAGWLNQ